jgi:hypothetical protein
VYTPKKDQGILVKGDIAMLTTAEEKQIVTTPLPNFKESTPSIPITMESFRDAVNDRQKLEAFFVEVGMVYAQLRYQTAILEESERLFRSEVIVAVQANPSLLEGKVTEKTTEAFYRAQSVFVEINKNIAKCRRDMQVVKIYFDLAASRLRIPCQESEAPTSDNLPS